MLPMNSRIVRGSFLRKYRLLVILITVVIVAGVNAIGLITFGEVFIIWELSAFTACAFVLCPTRHVAWDTLAGSGFGAGCIDKESSL